MDAHCAECLRHSGIMELQNAFVLSYDNDFQILPPNDIFSVRATFPTLPKSYKILSYYNLHFFRQASLENTWPNITNG